MPSEAGLEVVVRSYWNVLTLHLQFCDLWMVAKENPSRKNEMLSPFPRSSVIREWSRKKTQLEKRKEKEILRLKHRWENTPTFKFR